MATPPKIDRDETEFVSKAHGLARDEMAASFNRDVDRALRNALYGEYLEAGKPDDRISWLRPRLEKLFQCIGARPDWIEGQPDWPFLNGRPMTFLHQFDVPEFEFPDGRTSLASRCYVFCAGDPPQPRGWQMRYTVVQQFVSLKGLRRR